MAVKAPQDSLTASWLAVRLGIEPRKLEAMRRAGELIAFRQEGSNEYYYPLWQFDADWRPLPAVSRVVRAAREAGLSDNRLYALLNARAGLGGNRKLGEALREGRVDHVLRAIQAAKP
ncbi:MAG TPA: hypothetical protein VFL41_07710 [Gaiellaceae bacterium]|nr:hypothetical protein [Gaiellaceae bacterium]